MGNRRVPAIYFFITIFVVMGVITNTVFSEACFCGKSCRHSIQARLKNPSVFSLFHIHCAGAMCRGCGIEDGKNLKAACAKSPLTHAKNFFPAFVFPAFYGSPLTLQALMNSCFSYECRTAQSPPIFLQKCSWLC
jgi:hypothetical protein